jgi:hypothetical protein
MEYDNGETRVFDDHDDNNDEDNGATRVFDSEPDLGSTRIIGNDNAQTKKLVEDQPDMPVGDTIRLDDTVSHHELATYKSPIPSRLRVILPDHSEEIYTSLRPYLIIGRATRSGTSKVDIDLNPFDEGVQGISRVHAMIQPTPDGLVVKDLKSINGSQLNGERLEPNQPALLHTGDRIKIGNLKIEVHFIFED